MNKLYLSKAIILSYKIIINHVLSTVLQAVNRKLMEQVGDLPHVLLMNLTTLNTVNNKQLILISRSYLSF